MICYFRQLIIGHLKSWTFWFSFNYWCKPEFYLILNVDSLLWDSRLFTITVIWFKFHLFKLNLHIFFYFRLLFCPLVRNLNIPRILFLFADVIMIFSDISKFHISFLFVFITKVEHKCLFIFLLLIDTYCINIQRIFRFQFIRGILRRLLFLRLLRLLTKSSHIWNSRLLILNWDFRQQLSFFWRLLLTLDRRWLLPFW